MRQAPSRKKTSACLLLTLGSSRTRVAPGPGREPIRVGSASRLARRGRAGVNCPCRMVPMTSTRGEDVIVALPREARHYRAHERTHRSNPILAARGELVLLLRALTPKQLATNLSP